MAVQGGIIFGFDQDTPDIFDLTLEKMYEWELDAVEINILTPFPGTPLYDRLEREGRIISKDWKGYNQVDVVFKPKNMTEKELFEGSRKVAKEFYSTFNVIHRAFEHLLSSEILSRFYQRVPITHSGGIIREISSSKKPQRNVFFIDRRALSAAR